MTTSNSASWSIDEAQKNTRLDKFLVTQLPNESRSAIQKWITSGAVLVNGASVSKHYFLVPGDEVVYTPVVKEKVSLGAVPEVDILYSDDAVLVVNKPNGLLVHPTNSSAEHTMVDVALQHDPQIAEVGDDPRRPGIVHRLDREVSGVMVIAKTQQAFESLKKQFQERTVEKQYRAIVYGVPKNQSDVIRFKIAHSKTQGGKMAARPEHEDGKDAWTTFDVLGSYQRQYAELSVHIKTGRTHQIRAHLAAIDHPVVGDALYAKKRHQSDAIYPRLFLHAERLQVTHPVTGERMEWVSPIPKEFAELMHTTE